MYDIINGFLNRFYKIKILNLFEDLNVIVILYMINGLLKLKKIDVLVFDKFLL